MTHDEINATLQVAIMVLAFITVVIGFVISRNWHADQVCREYGHDWERKDEELVCLRCLRTPEDLDLA